MDQIDRGQLLDFIKFDEKVIAPEEHTAQDIVMMIQTAPTIAPPSNDPLTLEELREMDGEPVWTVVDNFQRGGYYCLCEKGVVMAPSGKRFDCKDIPDWIFLRRKPEEGET